MVCIEVYERKWVSMARGETIRGKKTESKKAAKRKERKKKKRKFTNTAVDSPTLVEGIDKVVATELGVTEVAEVVSVCKVTELLPTLSDPVPEFEIAVLVVGVVGVVNVEVGLVIVGLEVVGLEAVVLVVLVVLVVGVVVVEGVVVVDEDEVVPIAGGVVSDVGGATMRES